MSVTVCKHCKAIIPEAVMPVSEPKCPLCGKGQGTRLSTKTSVIVICVTLIGVIIVAALTANKANRVTTIVNK